MNRCGPTRNKKSVGRLPTRRKPIAAPTFDATGHCISRRAPCNCDPTTAQTLGRPGSPATRPPLARGPPAGPAPGPVPTTRAPIRPVRPTPQNARVPGPGSPPHEPPHRPTSPAPAPTPRLTSRDAGRLPRHASAPTLDRPHTGPASRPTAARPDRPAANRTSPPHNARRPRLAPPDDPAARASRLPTPRDVLRSIQTRRPLAPTGPAAHGLGV